MQHDFSAHGISESTDQPGGSRAADNLVSRKKTDALKQFNRIANKRMESSTWDTRANFAGDAPEIEHGYFDESRRQRGEQKFPRENDMRFDTDSPVVDTISYNRANNLDTKYIELKSKRNSEKEHKLEGKAGSGPPELEHSFSNCKDCGDELVEDGVPRSDRKNRSDKVADNPDVRGNNETEDPVHSPEVNGNLSPVSNESREEPFTGFEGSQKFPIKVTYKPPVAHQIEKFDRRHFGPPKMDIPDTTLATYPQTMSPDLPKSPGRDVLHRHRKVDENTEEERRQEVIDAIEKSNDTADGYWLPGASSGRRSSNLAGGKSLPEDKHVSTPSSSSTSLPATLPTSMSTGTSEEDSTDGSSFEQEGGEDEENGVTVSDVKLFDKISITILGLFEMTRGSEPRPEGPSELQAARLAVARVNEMNVLSKFQLRLIHNDTKVRMIFFNGTKERNAFSVCCVRMNASASMKMESGTRNGRRLFVI